MVALAVEVGSQPPTAELAEVLQHCVVDLEVEGRAVIAAALVEVDQSSVVRKAE